MLLPVSLFLVNGEKFESDSLKFCMCTKRTTRTMSAYTSVSFQDLRNNLDVKRVYYIEMTLQVFGVVIPHRTSTLRDHILLMHRGIYLSATPRY